MADLRQTLEPELGRLAEVLRIVADDVAVLHDRARQIDLKLSAKQAYRARRRRDEIFPSGLFRDPAWDILLDLFIAHEEGQGTTVTSVCVAAAASPTTALRTLCDLVDRGFVLRWRSQEDRRMSFVKLSGEGRALMTRYFENQAAG